MLAFKNVAIGYQPFHTNFKITLVKNCCLFPDYFVDKIKFISERMYSLVFIIHLLQLGILKRFSCGI